VSVNVCSYGDINVLIHILLFLHTAESAATPINMLDWQAQQKALKDQDRMSKTETAKMLHNYRGDTDDISSKLSTLKQEDRKSKQEAARLLHSYRGTADITGTTKSPKTRADGMPVEQGSAVDQRFGDESVASLAAGFNQNGVQDTTFPVQQQYEGHTFSPESAVMVDAPVVAPPIVVPEDSMQAPVASAVPDVQSPKTTEEDWVSVESSTVPSPEKIEDILAASSKDRNPGSFDSGEDTMSRAVTEKADNLDDDDDDMDDETEPVLTEAQLHASVSGGGHVSLRLDVEFSFGLVTNDLIPNTDKYMGAVSSIAHSLYSENRPAGTGGHAIYNPDFEPFVRFAEDDYAYAGLAAKRQLVHASLPMFIINWGEATSTREGVKDVLRAAVADGSFLRLALEACSTDRSN